MTTDDEPKAKRPTWPVRYHPGFEPLWRLGVAWLMTTKYGRTYSSAPWWMQLRRRVLNFYYDLTGYATALRENTRDAYDFMSPDDYEPVTPQEAISQDAEYWDDDSGDE